MRCLCLIFSLSHVCCLSESVFPLSVCLSVCLSVYCLRDWFLFFSFLFVFFFLIIFRFDKQTALCQFLDSSHSFRLTYIAYLENPVVLSVFFNSFKTILAYSNVHIVSKDNFIWRRCFFFIFVLHIPFCKVLLPGFSTSVDCPFMFFSAGILFLFSMSYMVMFAVAVCVEYPMMQLEKLIFKTNR